MKRCERPVGELHDRPGTGRLASQLADLSRSLRRLCAFIEPGRRAPRAIGESRLEQALRRGPGDVGLAGSRRSRLVRCGAVDDGISERGCARDPDLSPAIASTLDRARAFVASLAMIPLVALAPLPRLDLVDTFVQSNLFPDSLVAPDQTNSCRRHCHTPDIRRIGGSQIISRTTPATRVDGCRAASPWPTSPAWGRGSPGSCWAAGECTG